MNTTTTPPTVFALWFRKGRGDRWKEVCRGTERACTDFIAKAKGSGDWLTLPAGRHPDDRRPRA